MKQVLANANIVLRGEVIRGSIVIEDEVIAEIDQGRAVPAGAIDCDGAHIAAGLVELHTDNLERHMQPRPNVKWPVPAAIMAHDRELASVGITTVFDALRVGSLISVSYTGYGKYARPVATAILAARDAGCLSISHFLHLRAEVCSETLPDELDEFTPSDRIGIVSLMDHTPGQRQFRDMSKLAVYLKGKYGLTDQQMEKHFETRKALGDRVREPFSAAAIAAGNRLGAALASHDDTTEQDVAASGKAGCCIAEFPTTIEAAKASHASGISVIMGAPNYLRGGSHSGNVSASDCLETGVLDILSSDYAPSSLLMGAVRMGRDMQDLAAGLRTVSFNPARAAGLKDRGEIAPGLRADLVRFREHEGLPMVTGVWSRGRQI